MVRRPGRRIENMSAAQVEGDFHYDSRKAVLLWSILLVDDTNRSGQLEFSLPGSYPEDAFFPVDVSFSAQHTLADVSIAQARTILRPLISWPSPAMPYGAAALPCIAALWYSARRQHTGLGCAQQASSAQQGSRSHCSCPAFKSGWSSLRHCREVLAEQVPGCRLRSLCLGGVHTLLACILGEPAVHAALHAAGADAEGVFHRWCQRRTSSRCATRCAARSCPPGTRLYEPNRP